MQHKLDTTIGDRVFTVIVPPEQHSRGIYFVFTPDDEYEIVDCSEPHPEYGDSASPGVCVYSDNPEIGWHSDTNSSAHDNPPYSHGWFYDSVEVVEMTGEEVLAIQDTGRNARVVREYMTD